LRFLWSTLELSWFISTNRRASPGTAVVVKQ